MELGAFDTAALGALAASFEAALPAYYGLAPEAFESRLRPTVDTADPARLEQLFTLLQSLGYLGEGNDSSQPAITAALATWEADLAQAGDSIDWRIGSDEALHELPPEELARRRLKAAATLEGEAVLRTLPAIGENTLPARIAAFRISLLSDIAVPFGHAAFTALHRVKLNTLATQLDLPDPLAVLNLLGDIEPLTLRLHARFGDRALPLPPPPTPGTAAAAITVEPTGFIVNFLQVRLWMLGYYPGAIDRHWGTLSWTALRAFARDYLPSGWASDTSLVMPLDDQGWRPINLGRFLEIFAHRIDTPLHDVAQPHLIDAIDKVSAAYLQVGPRQQYKLQAEIDRAAAPDADEARLTVLADQQTRLGWTRPGADPAIHRRRYFGWRGLFAAIAGFLRKMGEAVGALAHRVVDKIVSFFRKAATAARQVVHFLVERTRLAVRIGHLALRRLSCWVTGTPVVTAENGVGCATLWQQDFDTLQLVTADCPPALRARHAQTIEWMHASFAFLLGVGIEIVKLIEAVALAWWLLAWRVLAAVRAVVAEWREFARRVDLADYFGATEVL